MASGYNCFGYNSTGYVNSCAAPPTPAVTQTPAGGKKKRRRYGAVKIRGETYIVGEDDLEALLEKLLADEFREVKADTDKRVAMRIARGKPVGTKLTDAKIELPRFEAAISDIGRQLDDQAVQVARAFLERRLAELQDDADIERLIALDDMETQKLLQKLLSLIH